MHTNKYVFVCFVDLKKVFDTVNRHALLYKLFRYNITGNFLNILENMYKNVSFSVKLQDGLNQCWKTCTQYLLKKKKHCHIKIFYEISNQIKIWKQFKAQQ
jgi:hypothetical protein